MLLAIGEFLEFVFLCETSSNCYMMRRKEDLIWTNYKIKFDNSINLYKIIVLCRIPQFKTYIHKTFWLLDSSGRRLDFRLGITFYDSIASGSIKDSFVQFAEKSGWGTDYICFLSSVIAYDNLNLHPELAIKHDDRSYFQIYNEVIQLPPMMYIYLINLVNTGNSTMLVDSMLGQLFNLNSISGMSDVSVSNWWGE